MTALVVLAAGASRRLGACKATVSIGPRSALEHILAAAFEAGFPSGLVVTGADDIAIREHLADGEFASRAECVTHPDWDLGRTTSAACAARARPGRDLCIATLDAPMVPAPIYRVLREEWVLREQPALGWLAPAYRTPAGLRHGHPFLIGRELAERISELAPEQSLRSLRENASLLWDLEVDSESVLDRLDTPDDLETIRERFATS